MLEMFSSFNNQGLAQYYCVLVNPSKTIFRQTLLMFMEVPLCSLFERLSNYGTQALANHDFRPYVSMYSLNAD